MYGGTATETGSDAERKGATIRDKGKGASKNKSRKKAAIRDEVSDEGRVRYSNKGV